MRAWKWETNDTKLAWLLFVNYGEGTKPLPESAVGEQPAASGGRKLLLPKHLLSPELLLPTYLSRLFKLFWLPGPIAANPCLLKLSSGEKHRSLKEKWVPEPTHDSGEGK